MYVRWGRVCAGFHWLSRPTGSRRCEGDEADGFVIPGNLLNSRKSTTEGTSCTIGFLNHLKLVIAVRTACFNIQQLCIFPIECIYGFHMILRINSDYLPKHL
jgi:hypothetical protein